MIIDTDKLRKAISDYCGKRAAKIDEWKDDRAAISALTRLETMELELNVGISTVEDIWKRYAPKETDEPDEEQALIEDHEREVEARMIKNETLTVQPMPDEVVATD